MSQETETATEKSETAPQAAEPVAIPVADAPVVVQRVKIEVLSDGSMRLEQTPQQPTWALVGLLSVMTKNLGG